MGDIVNNKEFFDYLLVSGLLNKECMSVIKRLYPIKVNVVEYLKDKVKDKYFKAYLDIIEAVYDYSDVYKLKERYDDIFSFYNRYKKYKIDSRVYVSYLSVLMIKLDFGNVSDEDFKREVLLGNQIQVNFLKDVSFEYRGVKYEVRAYDNKHLMVSYDNVKVGNVVMLGLKDSGLDYCFHEVEKNILLKEKSYDLVILRNYAY